jgi:hypothetical protein
MVRFPLFRPRTLVVLSAILGVVLLLAGCSSSASTNSQPTATSAATATATATAVPTVAPSVITACFGPNVKASQVVLSGDFLFTQLQVGGLSYPSVMLPDGTPTSKPYKLTSAGPDDYATDFPNSPITNPAMAERGGGGFTFSVCNISPSAKHVLQSVSATLVSFTAYSGSLSEWQACNGALDSHHNFTGGGCGGAIAGCDCFHAKFPNNSAVGTQEVMTQTDTTLDNPGDNLAKLPFSLAPGKSVTLFVGMDTPQPAGQYGFSFSLQLDGTPVSSPNSPVVLLAPVAHEWGGLACQTPSFLAQITPTNPESYYICPK